MKNPYFLLHVSWRMSQTKCENVAEPNLDGEKRRVGKKDAPLSYRVPFQILEDLSQEQARWKFWSSLLRLAAKGSQYVFSFLLPCPPPWWGVPPSMTRSGEAKFDLHCEINVARAAASQLSLSATTAALWRFYKSFYLSRSFRNDSLANSSGWKEAESTLSSSACSFAIRSISSSTILLFFALYSSAVIVPALYISRLGVRYAPSSAVETACASLQHLSSFLLQFSKNYKFTLLKILPFLFGESYRTSHNWKAMTIQYPPLRLLPIRSSSCLTRQQNTSISEYNVTFQCLFKNRSIKFWKTNKQKKRKKKKHCGWEEVASLHVVSTRKA